MLPMCNINNVYMYNYVIIIIIVTVTVYMYFYHHMSCVTMVIGIMLMQYVYDDRARTRDHVTGCGYIISISGISGYDNCSGDTRHRAR